MKNLAFLFLLTFMIVLQKPSFAQVGTKITQTSLVRAKLGSVLHVSCFGDKKGAIDVIVSGGIPPYTYHWSNGATSQDIAGLAAGIYTLIVSDAQKCPDTLKVEVKQPEKLSVQLDSIADVLCYGFNRGSVDVTIKGGVQPYTYSWSNQINSEDLRNVPAGEYALLVTDANHCQEIISAEVKQNPLIVRSDEKVQNVDCSGDKTGKIDIAVSGGVAPYSYAWVSGEKTEDLANLSAGTYTIQVTDSRGCLETYSTKVLEPSPVSIKLEEVRNINCAGDKSGAIDISVEGGIKPYAYKWNENLALTEDIGGLSAGMYELVVKDAKNCIKKLNQVITEPEPIGVKITDVKNVVNFGESNGAIFLDVKGGISPYIFEWSSGPKTKDIENIPANNYTCRITDANKCVNFISVNIEQPTMLEAEIKKLEHNKCNGEKKGYIDVIVKGGVTPYKFSWSNGELIQDIKNLAAGDYSLTVTDAHGMIKTLKGTIEQPTALVTGIQSVSHNLCFGDRQGIADINVSGGTPPYSYNWNNGEKTQDIANAPAGNYVVQVIDKNQCLDTLSVAIEQNPILDVKAQETRDIKCFGKAEGLVNIAVTGGVAPYKYSWNNGAITPNLTNIKAGQYNLKVSDIKGCQKTLEVSIKEPPLLESNVSEITNVKCKGDSTGSVKLNIRGGTSPYAFQWNNGHQTKDNSRIKAGDYNVTITDAKGCINALSATIVEPTKLTSSIDKVVNIDCFDESTGAIDVSVDGGIKPYTYKWSNGVTTQNLTGIKAGDYKLTIKDLNGCETGIQANVVQNTPLLASTDKLTHVNCFGLNTGSAEIGVKGGVEPYTFKWNNGAKTKNISKLGAGNYSLLVTDAKSCTATINLSINEPTKFKGKITGITQIRCHNDSNAVVLTSFEGGVVPYNFLWNNKKTIKDIDHLGAGKYTLIASDKNDCKDTLETVIEQPAELDLQLLSTANNQCNGEKNGTIDIFVKGSVLPYTYVWSNGAKTQDLSHLQAGKYTISVMGATGCEKSLSTEIKEPEALELSIVSTEDIKCFDGNNGKIDLAVKGGVQPYKFSWSNGVTTEDLVNLVAGSYSVNVVDKQGCRNQTSYQIKQPEPFVASLAEVRNINCYGDSTGAIRINKSGGTLPYKFKWSNGDSIENISNLKVGNYSVSITDAKGCSQNIAASITQPEPLIAGTETVQDVLCKDQKTGNIDISVKGGVTPYSYTWSDGSKEQDIKAAGAGNYNVKIQDAKGCFKMLEAKIAEPSRLNVTVEEVKNILEYGREDGSIKIKVEGGKSPYLYSWSNGIITQNIKDLVAGNYSVIVNDSYGCRQDLDVSIKQPDEIKINIDSIQHIFCYGEKSGYIKTSVRGGVEPYRYSWSNGVTVDKLEKASAGDYLLTVTDANNTTKMLKVSLEQPPLYILAIDSVLHPTCYELNNGIIKTSVRGGTSPYTFTWNNGSLNQNQKGLPSGSYKITVKDARGCLLENTITLNKPEPLEVTLVNTEDIKCNGDPKGKANILVKGGTAPYQYNWSNGLKEQNLSNALAGNYTLKVMDAKQCSKNITATINEPPAMLANFAAIKNVPCKGENKASITTSVTGGTPPYKYLWNNGSSTDAIQNLIAGKYDVTINDINGCISKLSTDITEPNLLTGIIVNDNDINCFGAKEGSVTIDVQGGTLPYRFNWSNGGKDQNIKSVPAGKYNVKVTDKQGCEVSLETTIKEPPQLLASISGIQHIKCFGEFAGAIDASIKGGVEPYKYSWSNGAKTQDLLKVAAGKYILKVIDSKGCTNTVAAIIEEPLPLNVENNVITDNHCSGEKIGNVTISVKGGKEPYAYKWSNGAATKDIRDLIAGNYELTLTDANGCMKTNTATVKEPPILYKNIDAINHISCNGESNGSIHISVSGGTATYSYLWSNGYTEQDLLNVPAGSYSVIIKEGNGCETKLQATITEPAPFVANLVAVTHNNCYSDKNGSITINTEGGTTPYSFKWNNNAVTQNLTNLGAGDYTVFVSDANRCNHTIKTTVTEPPKLVLTIDSARNVKCCGDTSGAVFISVTGGVGPYKYLWTNGKTTQDVTGLAQGQYAVLVTDLNGCVVNTPEEGTTIYEKMIAQGKFVSRDILFDVGKSIIKEQSFIEISRIASFMKEHPELRFSIEGHTDSQGDDAANMVLSKQRAESVRKGLIKFGIDPPRLETKGFGESVPIDTNTTVEGRANNRRVEFIPI